MKYGNDIEQLRREPTIWSRRPRLLSMLLLIGTLTLCLRTSSGDETKESPSDILIVVNKASDTGSVSEEEIKNIFLLRRERWSSGQSVVPINAPAQSPLREAFAKRVLGMRVDEEQTYWHRYKIRNGSNPPPEFPNTLKAVFMLKAGVSYIFRSDFKEGVAKVVLVIPDKS